MTQEGCVKVTRIHSASLLDPGGNLGLPCSKFFTSSSVPKQLCKKSSPWHPKFLSTPLINLALLPTLSNPSQLLTPLSQLPAPALPLAVHICSPVDICLPVDIPQTGQAFSVTRFSTLSQNIPLGLPALTKFVCVPVTLCACLSQPHETVNSPTMSCFLLPFAPPKEETGGNRAV